MKCVLNNTSRLINILNKCLMISLISKELYVQNEQETLPTFPTAWKPNVPLRATASLVRFSLDPYQKFTFRGNAGFGSCFQYNLLVFHFLLIELSLHQSLAIEQFTSSVWWHRQLSIVLLIDCVFPVTWSYEHVLVFLDVCVPFFV